MRIATTIAVALAAVASPALAQSDARPTDRRELSTDRPDKTESPYSVDQGRFQIEMDIATYTRDRSQGIRTETLSVAPINFKYGVGRNADLQVIVEPYIRQTVTARSLGIRDTTDGVGDVTVRFKQNLWGNDGGKTALAIMPFVKLPTNSGGLGNNKAEFGVIVPLAIGVSDDVGIGLMTQVDVVEDDDTKGYRVNFINSATVGIGLTDRLGMYTELFVERNADWIVTGDVGLTYALSDFTQLDVGANVGVTDAADDIAVFVGISRRF